MPDRYINVCMHVCIYFILKQTFAANNTKKTRETQEIQREYSELE